MEKLRRTSSKLQRLLRESPPEASRLFAMDCFLYAKKYAESAVTGFTLSACKREALNTCKQLALSPNADPNSTKIKRLRGMLFHQLHVIINELYPQQVITDLNLGMFGRMNVAKRDQMNLLLLRISYDAISSSHVEAANNCFYELSSIGIVRASWPIQRMMCRVREVQLKHRQALLSALRHRQTQLIQSQQYKSCLEEALFSGE